MHMQVDFSGITVVTNLKDKNRDIFLMFWVAILNSDFR